MYDVSEKSITQLNTDLQSGAVTSYELVLAYLDRIGKYDSGKLNSVAQINPDAIAIAQKCDAMRTEGTEEGCLFGIPILIKDNIDTGDAMANTAGSLALCDNYSLGDSALVSRLREEGAIILGKTNLSEFAYFMTTGAPSGYSSRGGQVINPYHESLTPSGSSSGSGVAAACSFAAACVGTETNGSIISPSKNNCVVGIKPSVGLISRRGIIPISSTQDTAGPMGRTVLDCAILLTAMAGFDSHGADQATLSIPEECVDIDFADFTNKSPKGLRIGYPIKPSGDYTFTHESESLNLAVDALKKAGCTLVPIDMSDFSYDRNKSRHILFHEFKVGLNSYLARGRSRCKSLSDIIAYNKAHSQACLKYGQTILEESDSTDGRLTHKDYIDALLDVTAYCQNYIDKTILDNNLDLFIQANYNAIHAISGYPCITVPTGIPDATEGGKNILFIGKKWSEGKLITAAHTFERATMLRQKPLLSHEF